jgi:DNA-binding MarR family transcriptional regulator
MRIEDEIKSRGFTNENSKAVINVLFTASWLHARISAHLKPYGLSHEQFNVLRILLGQHPNPVAQKDILHRMIDRNSNLTRILSKLSTKALVTICRSDCDRREYQIRLTTEAIALLETLQMTMVQSADTFLGLSVSEAFHLNALLDKMRDTP